MCGSEARREGARGRPSPIALKTRALSWRDLAQDAPCILIWLLITTLHYPRPMRIYRK